MIVPESHFPVKANIYSVVKLVLRSTNVERLDIPLQTRLQALAVIAPNGEKKVGYHGMNSVKWLISGSGVPIASKNSEDNSPHTCLRATDGSTRSSPAQSQTIKHLIQTDSKQPPKRRRQDSTYASCDSSEFASTENTTTAAEVSSRGLELVPAINSPTTSMPMDSVFYCFPSMPMDNLCFSPAAWDFSTYEHSYSLIGSPDFTPQGNLGLSQEDSELKDNISKNLGPGADSLLGLSETNPLGREEVPNVHPADFLAIYRTKSWSPSNLLIPVLTEFKALVRCKNLRRLLSSS